MPRILRPLTLLLSVITYIILLQGALVTNTGSGQGCGQNWPLCQGTFMPAWNYNSIIEFSHRFVTGICGIGVLLLIYLVYRYQLSRRIRFLSLVTLTTVLIQSLLGAANVLWPQPKWILALHFGISLICFSAVLLTTVDLFQAGKASPERNAIDPGFRRWTLQTMLFFYMIVYLGAFVRHTGAALACTGFPDCNGALFPGFSGQVGAAYAHRVAAFLGLILIVRLTLMALKQPSRAVRRAGIIALILVVAQICSGAAMALGQYHLLTQMLHGAIISALWGVLSVLLMLAWDANPAVTKD
ncbi:MAG TPA: COX15/CtaA family protein [Symbiobacteriaceae bacterium]|nr:COX15/CtaA family protein [Symbiobacteriaceae bacterium]